jgi:hypothetical protein
MAFLDGPDTFTPGDVGVPAAVAPLGIFPSYRSSCGIGSPKLVTDIPSRDAIPANYRAEGMYCYVASTQQVFMLIGGILNANWVLQVGSAASNVQTFGPYVGAPVVGDAVYMNAGGSFDQADATSQATAKVVGLVLVVDFPAVGQVTVVTNGRIGGFLGLTPGFTYILGTSPGLLLDEGDTLNPFYPTAVGNVVIPVAIALSATDLNVNVSGYALAL